MICKNMRIPNYLFLAVALCVNVQAATNSLVSPNWSRMNSKERFYALMFTTPAYQREALRLIIEEANRVALELNLPEPLPITRTNLLEAYLSPPRLAHASRAIGNITTSNYNYCVSVGNKFSFLVRTHLEAEEMRAHAQYLWPMSRLDTNAAYQMATQFLKAASMDVNALNTNCILRVATCLLEGPNGKHFVPLYWVTWSEKNNERGGASVELCLPTRTLLQMHVNKSEYILRKPLEISNLDYLLSQTNAPAETNVPANH
jgi:hypothetical protein